MGDPKKWGKSPLIWGCVQTVISGTFLKLSEICKCSKYSSGSQLSNGTQHIGLWITLWDPRVILRQAIRKSGIFVRYFQPVISGTFLKLSEVCKCSKYSSGSQLSNGTQHLGLRITLWDPRVILRGGVLRCVILMTEMILGGDSYEKSCWKWSGMHSVTTIWVWDITLVILGVILGVV